MVEKIFDSLLIIGFIFLIVGCGVKKPPVPAFTTPLPFEDLNKSSPTPTPPKAPSTSS